MRSVGQTGKAVRRGGSRGRSVFRACPAACRPRGVVRAGSSLALPACGLAAAGVRRCQRACLPAGRPSPSRAFSCAGLRLGSSAHPAGILCPSSRAPGARGGSGAWLVFPACPYLHGAKMRPRQLIRPIFAIKNNCLCVFRGPRVGRVSVRPWVPCWCLGPAAAVIGRWRPGWLVGACCAGLLRIRAFSGSLGGIIEEACPGLRRASSAFRAQPLFRCRPLGRSASLLRSRCRGPGS